MTRSGYTRNQIEAVFMHHRALYLEWWYVLALSIHVSALSMGIWLSLYSFYMGLVVSQSHTTMTMGSIFKGASYWYFLNTYHENKIGWIKLFGGTKVQPVNIRIYSHKSDAFDIGFESSRNFVDFSGYINEINRSKSYNTSQVFSYDT